jgi:hypothetical protein
MVEREAIYSEERTPGIGSGARDVGGVGIDGVNVDVGMTQLRMLLLSVESALPSNANPATIPVYLGATAGMRLVDASVGANLLSDVRKVLRESNFLFANDGWARIISGEEEGAYDWLVANYLANDGYMPRYDAEYDIDVRLRGAMDLGGASVQVSYLASSSSTKNTTTTTTTGKSNHEPKRYPLRIGDDVEYPVYTRSLLNYGVDRGRARYDMEFVTSSSSQSHEVGNNNNNTNPCYPIGYNDPKTNITGSSDWEACLRGVAQLFDRTTSRINCGGSRRVGGGGDTDDDCHDNNDFPIIDYDRKFIAMSAFVYIWDYLGLRIGNETDDLLTLKTNARRVCGMNQTQQASMYEKHMIDNDITNDRKTNKPHVQCFNAAFAYHLLSTSFGLPLADTPIEIYHDIGGTKVQWALGLMLVEANKQLDDDHVLEKEHAHNKTIVDRNVDTTRGLFVYFTFILLASVIALFRFRRKRSTTHGRLPVVDPDDGIILDFSPQKVK